MLTQETIKIVKSTAPILQEHAETLTRHFYERMFKHNPEVAPLFNASHQNGGNQQRALAGAITAFAMNIENLETLASAVELISQKHASLMIKPEHYPIVGQNLLASICEVLNINAEDDIISAWSEAYNFLANILINRENQIYVSNAEKLGGWYGFKPLRIIRKEKESSNITSFYLACQDGSSLPIFNPGQYITLRIKAPGNTTTMRNYSLSDKPRLDYFRISVKRELSLTPNAPDGYVSNALHDRFEVGDIIEVAPPCGDFFLNSAEKSLRPLVLLAGGVGITPITSILKTALDLFPEREVILIHAVMNQDMQAFSSIFDALSKEHKNLKVYYRYSDNLPVNIANASKGYITEDYLDTLLKNRDADYYFCGPQPFLVALYRLLNKWEIPASQLNFEFFGPRQELEKAA